jgi:autotransporter-associated beta strand protein
MPAHLPLGKHLWPALAGFLFCLMLASPARAIDYTWIGPVMGAAGDWDDPANWAPAPADPPPGPVPGDTITFDTNVNLMMGADRVVDSVTVNSNSMSFINFALETTDMTVGAASISASNDLTVNNGTLDIATRYQIISGNLIVNGTNNITGLGVFWIDAGCSILLNGNQNMRLSDTQVDPDAEINLSNGAVLTILEGEVPCPTIGNGSLNINSPGGTIDIEDRAQTYSGFTRVSAGTLRARGGDLPATTDLTIYPGAMARLGWQTLNTISGSGNLSIDAGTVEVGGTSTFSGNISETGDRSFIKDGPGTLTLTGNVDTDIVLDSGGLVFNGASQQRITQNGGNLKGTGSCNDSLTISNGVFEPGGSIGTFSTAADFVMQAASNLDIEVGGYSADQVSVGSDVTLNNPILSVSGTPYRNYAYTIIRNNGANPVAGTFNMQPEGSDFEGVGGYFYRITYQGGDGNDVVLTSLNGVNPPNPAPEPEPTPDPRPVPNVTPDDSPSPTGSLNGPVISWPKVGGTNHYNIYRAACPTCPKEHVGRVAGTSFTDETALPGQVYYYFIRSDNGALSDYSDWIPAWRYEQNPGRAGDFNGDGIMDLLWWDPDSGQLKIWLMNGGEVQSVSAPGDGLGISQWLLVNTGDFNADGICDMLWWDPETGEAAIWYMTAQTAASTGFAASSTTAGDITGNVTLSFTGDLNGDDRADLVWRDYSNGQVTVWLMGEDGTPFFNGPPTLTEGMTDGNKPGLTESLEWTVRGLSDMNADHKADVVWQHGSDGRVVVWLMDGAEAIGFSEYQRTEPDNWRLAGLGDLNGDGLGDIVWRNDATGQVQAWLMTGADPAYDQRDIAMGEEALSWQVKAVGDFCSPGCDDVYYKHSETCAALIVTLDGREFHPSAE